MSKFSLKVTASFGIILLTSLSLVIIMDMIGYAQNTQTVSGLNFQVPDDWPIEKRGGIVAPIPTEEYVSIKFEATEAEFQTIKNDLSAKFDELKLNLENMEIKFLKEIKSAQVLDEDQGGISEDLSDILEKLGLLESQLGRLDRKVTSKTAELKMKSGDTARRISAVENKVDSLQTQIYKLSEEIDYIFEKQEKSISEEDYDQAAKEKC